MENGFLGNIYVMKRVEKIFFDLVLKGADFEYFIVSLKMDGH